MDLIGIVDKYLENPSKILTGSRKGAHHPSSASCIIKNEYGEECVVGKCLREIYWEQKGIKQTNPMTARGSRICGVGKLVEGFEIEQYKRIGIWRDNNVKFFDEINNISGEADAIVYDKDTDSLRGIEIKTGYDYKFRSEVLGTPFRAGKPKPEHLLQTMLYINYFKIPFSILYFDRGNAQRGQYDITLNNDGTPNIDGKKLSNGISIPRCLARYKEVEACVKDNVVPKRDFQLKYSKDKIDIMSKTKRLNKAQKEEYDKSGDADMGDYQCSYCGYKDYCWKEGK